MKLRLPLSLASAVLVACACTYTTTIASAATSGKSISINFTQEAAALSGTSDDAVGADPVAAKYWNNALGGAANTSANTDAWNKGRGTAGQVIDSNGDVLLGTQISWKAANNGMWNSGAGTASEASKLQHNYLDDGGAGSSGYYTNIVDLPFLQSTVYILLSGDGGKFGTVQVNGTNYMGSGAATVEGTGSWGERKAAAGNVWTEGTNYLKINASGTDISISSVGTSGGRTTVAGIQIVDAYEGNLVTYTLSPGSQTWDSVVAAESTAQAFVADAGGSTLTITTASTDGIILQAGTLTLSGGTLAMTGPSTLSAYTGTTLNVDTTISTPLTINGGGTIKFLKDQTFTSLSSSSAVSLASGVNLTVESGSVQSFDFEGTSSITKIGTGDFAIASPAAPSGSSSINVQAGTLIFGSLASPLTTIDLSSVTGAGNIGLRLSGNLSDGGGGDPAIPKITALNAGFTGALDIRLGLLDIASPGVLSHNFILNGGGLLGTGANSYNVATDVTIGANNGYIRTWGSTTITVSGKILGAGRLTKTDGGKIVLAGDMSGFSGAFRNGGGTTDINTTANFSNIHIVAGTVNVAGDVTITGGTAESIQVTTIEGASTFNITGKYTSEKSRWQVRKTTINIGDDSNAAAEVRLAGFVFTDGNGGNPSVLNLKSGTLTITGKINNGYKGSSVVLSHWSGTGTFNMSGGVFNSAEAIIYTTGDGKGVWNLTGGVANIIGLEFTGNSEFYLNGGRLNLGEKGIKGEGSNRIAKLESGIIGAYTDWSSSKNMTLINSTDGVVFNTEHAPDPTEAGHTITLSGILSGDGKIVKDGKGTLSITGTANTFTGGVILKNGTLLIAGEGSIGEAASRSITVADKGAGGIGAELILNYEGSTLNLNSFNIQEGGSLNIGAAATVDQIFNVASDSTWSGGTAGSVLAMDIGDKVNFTGGLTIDGNMGLLVNMVGAVVGQSYTLVTTGTGVTGFANLVLQQPSAARAFTANLSLDSGNNIVLNVTGGGAATLTWTGTTGTWELNQASSLWDTSEADKTFYEYDSVVFNDAPASAQTVTIVGDVKPGNVTLNNSIAYTFTGGNVTVAGTFLKDNTGDAAFTNTTIAIEGEAALNNGSVTLGANSTFILQSTASLTNAGGTWGFDGGILNVSEYSEGNDLGAISSISANLGTINIGAQNISAGYSSGTVSANGIVIAGTGNFKVSGSNVLRVVGDNPTATLYAGTGGIHYTGIYAGKGIYGGSWEAQTEASGKVIIGSTDASIITTMTGAQQRGFLYSVGTETTDRNATVLIDTTIQGSLTRDDILDTDGAPISGVTSNTTITGSIYGAGNSSTTNAYGSTILTLSGVHVTGSVTADYISGSNPSVIVIGPNNGGYVYGDVTLNVKNSYIDSRIFGTAGRIKGNLTFNSEDSYFAKAIYLGPSSGGHALVGDIFFTDKGSTFAESLYIGRDATSDADWTPSSAVTAHITDSLFKKDLVLSYVHKDYVSSVDFTMDGTAKVEMSVAALASGRSITGDISFNIKDNATIGGALYGTGWNGGNSTGNITINVQDDAQIGMIYGSRKGSANHTGKIDITISGNSTVSELYAGAIQAGTITGNTTVTIKDSAEVGKFWGLGYNDGGSAKTIQDGDLTINISGGKVGEGLTGTGKYDMFLIAGGDGLIKGDVTLNVSGGSIMNEHLGVIYAGTVESESFGGIGGDFKINLSGTGVIESNLSVGSNWGPNGVRGNIDILLDGGSLGKAGHTRTMSMARLNSNGGTLVGGDVNIVMGGGSDGKGTTFLGTYNVLAGATNFSGTGVAGNTSVTLKDITVAGGVSTWAGVLSGANDTGGGVSGTSRTLTIDNYKTELNAQLKHFTAATVQNASDITLKGAGTSIGTWTIADTSKVTTSLIASLGTPTSITLSETTASLIYLGSGEMLASTVTGTGKLQVGNGGTPAALILSGDFSTHTGDLMASGATDSAVFTHAANSVVASKLTGSGFVAINNAAGISTKFTNTGSTVATLYAMAGIAELADGVKMGSTTAMTLAPGTIKLNAADLNNTFSSFTGAGTVLVANAAATWSDSTLSTFAGTVKVADNAALTYTFTDTASLGSSLSLGLSTSSKLTLENNSSAAVNYTAADFVLSGAGNELHLTGTNGIILDFTNSDWVTDYSTGEVTIYRGLETSDFKVKGGDESYGAYSNIFLVEDGIMYQAKTDSAGYLVKLTVEDMTELPAIGAIEGSTSIKPFRITGRAGDTSGTLTLTGDVNIASLTINANDGETVGTPLPEPDPNFTPHNPNYKWDLNGHSVVLMNGNLFFQTNADSLPTNPEGSYLITGGTLTGSETKLVITQTSGDYDLTIASEIVDNGSGNTALHKQGVGKLILSGVLSNTGGIEAVNGTLQLQGAATGVAGTTLTTSSSTAAAVILGDGTNDYALALDVVNGATSTITVNAKASFAGTVSNDGTIVVLNGTNISDLSNITNDGTIDFQLGSGNSMSVAGVLPGTGTIQATSGSVEFTSMQSTTQAVTVDSGATAQFNLSAQANTLGAINGDGTIILKNGNTSYLNLENNILGSDWSNFEGTLVLEASDNNAVLRAAFVENIGASALNSPTVDVRNGAQYWDKAPAGTITNDWKLAGSGEDGFGAIRIQNGTTYSGDISIDNTTGATIGGPNGSATLSGTISGGVLSLGSTNKSNSWSTSTTLSGTNTHASTTVLQGTVIAQSDSALGGGLTLSYDTSFAELETAVTLGFLNGTNATSKVTMGAGSGITLTGTDTSSFAGILEGTGALTLNGTGLVTLSGNNTFTGDITLNSGSSLTASSATALGNAANSVAVKDGATLNLSGNAFTNAVKVDPYGTLSGFGNYNGDLEIVGAAGQTTTINGSLKANSLSLGVDAKATVSGNVTIVNGGEVFLNAANESSTTAMVTATGTISMGGTFLVAFDTSDYYDGETLTYNIAKSASGKVNNHGGLEFVMNMDPAYNRFFELDSNYLTRFMNTGDLILNINRLVVKGALIPVAEGPDPYQSQGQIYYLGAKDPAVTFTGTYDRAANDPHYRLTNGKGILTFDSATQLTDKDSSTPSALIINDYTDESVSNARGVVMLAKDNTYTGGTDVFNVHLTSDPNGTTGEIKTFGTGEISMLGNNAILDLEGNDADSYSYQNDIRLTDGATLTQSGGANELNGNITIGTGAASTLSNTGGEVLAMNGNLSGRDLILQGGGSGYVLNNTVANQADRTLNSLTLKNNAVFDLDNGANLTVGTLNIESGDIYVNTDTEFTISGGEANGAGNIIMNGGTLHVTRNLNLNGAGEVNLVFRPEPYTRALTPGSTLDVTSGNTLTVTDAVSTVDASFTKIGEGNLIFTGDSSGFLGTAKVVEGSMDILMTTVFDFGGSLEVGGGTSTATLFLANGVTIKGDLTIHTNGVVNTSNNLVVEGDLVIDQNVDYISKAKAQYQGDVIVGQNSSLLLSEGTLLGYDGSAVTLSSGSSIHFGTGKGSQFTGVLREPLTFVANSSYEGFLNVYDNEIVFEAGSIYKVSGSMKYKEAGSVTGALQSKNTVTLNRDMVFEMNNFTENNLERYANGFTLISTSGNNGELVFEDGSLLVENGDYSFMLADSAYEWLQFALVGGINGKTLDLNVFTSAKYENIAETTNEEALVPLANNLANNFGNYDGELKSLGANLALATGNSKQMLNNLALSTSSAMAAYQVQMSNLRRHAFDVLNRATQESTGAERLSYEQHVNTIWANAIGGTYKLDSDSNALGNTTNVWGGTLGYSRAVSENMSVGLAFTYTGSDTDLNDGFGTASSDAYYIDAFARYHKNNWNVIGAVTGGFTSNDIERNMRVGDYASKTKGSADGSQIYAMLQAGYEFSLSKDDQTLLEPFALIAAGYSSIDGFTESGAGNAGLIVDSQSQGLCTIGAGLRVVHNFFTNTNELNKGRFEARAMVLQDVTDTDVNVDASFIGASDYRFSQKGMNSGKTAFVIGAGVVVPIADQTSIFADVDGEFRSSETGVRANVGIKFSF